METFNLIIQTLHSLARWGLVILGLIAIFRGLSGWMGKKEFTAADNRAGMLYTMVFDVQLLLGILLYLSKGWFGVLIADFGAAIGSGTRFFAIEHLLMMFASAVVAHIGRSQARKAADAMQKHRRGGVWEGLAFFLMLAGGAPPFSSRS